MSFYLCVDCGGSKTSAVVSDSSGNVLGRSRAGPSNFSYLGLDPFISTVRYAVGNALEAANVSLPPDIAFAAAWFGISGVDSNAAIAAITPALSTLVGILPGPRLIIANDTHLLAAPLRLHPDISHAVACIAGTGSNSVSFKETDGKLGGHGRIGGWGGILGDEGGGFHVGREAIRRLLLENDIASLNVTPRETTVTSTTLKARVLEKFGVTEILEILTLVHLPDPSPSTVHAPYAPPYLLIPRDKRLSSLSPLVFASAFDDGDPLALGVLRTCAGMLASQIAILLSPASQQETIKDSRTVNPRHTVLCFGGSLAGVDTYREMVLEELKRGGHVFRYVEYINDAAEAGVSALAAAHSV